MASTVPGVQAHVVAVPAGKTTASPVHNERLFCVALSWFDMASAEPNWFLHSRVAFSAGGGLCWFLGDAGLIPGRCRACS